MLLLHHKFHKNWRRTHLNLYKLEAESSIFMTDINSIEILNKFSKREYYLLILYPDGSSG